MFKKAAVLIAIVGAVIAGWSSMALACGGFFCQNDPVDQTGERIVFTVNDDNTVTSLIEIQYQGSAEDFSWILPLPEAIAAEDLAVPDDGQLVFDELHAMTDVRFIAPDLPDCARDELQFMTETTAAADSVDEVVQVFASGEVGPFGFDVIGSEDPNALIDWLRDTNYRVTPEMEPLINVYVEEEAAFIAMRLLDGETSESIQPIEITYPGSEPVIPLRLTAVAAQANMPIWVWVFGQHQAEATNFGNMEIATEEITFFPAGGNDYTFLVQQQANAFDGQAFITEFAREVSPTEFASPWLAAQSETAPYLTRMNTFIDPEEMTADPAFGFNADLGDVSRERDASDLQGLYSCERDSGGGLRGAIFGKDNRDAIDPEDGTGQVVAFTPNVPEGEGEQEAPELALVDDQVIDNDSVDENAAADPGLDSSSGGGVNALLLLLVPVALLGGLFIGLRLRNTQG